MKKINVFIGLLIFFEISCSFQNLDNLKLNIIKQKISFLTNSYYRDSNIIDSKSLEDIIKYLKNIFIDENNYEFVFELNNDTNILNIFNDEVLLAEMKFKITIFKNNSTIFGTGRLYTSIDTFYGFGIKQDVYFFDEPNISFTHIFEDSSKYVYENTYHTNGSIMYTIKKKDLLHPDYLLLENITIYRDLIE